MNNQRRALAVFALAGALFMAILVSSSGTRSADAQGVLTPGGRGTITAVYGGSGLTGSATSGSATLNVGAGSGITVGADAISADTTYLQRRLGECSAGSAVQSYAENGTPTCVIAGDITGITAGSGMTGDATSGAATLAVGATSGGGLTLGADSIGIRTDCASSEGLAWDGDSWECSALGSTYTAGDGLTLTGSDFDVVPHANGGLAIVSDQVSMLQSCSSTQVLKWNGSAWACAADANSALVTNGVIPKGNGTTQVASIMTESGGLIGVSGGVYATGAGIFDGAVTIGNASGDAHALTGTLNANSTAGSEGEVLTISGGLPTWQTAAASVIAGTNIDVSGSTVSVEPTVSLAGASGEDTLDVANSATSQTASLRGVDVAMSSTYDVTGGDLVSHGVYVNMTSDKSASSASTNAMTNIAGRFEATHTTDVNFNYGVYATAATIDTVGCPLCEVEGAVPAAYGVYATATGDVAYSGYFDQGRFVVNGNAEMTTAQFAGDVEIGDASSDTLTVNATATVAQLRGAKQTSASTGSLADFALDDNAAILYFSNSGGQTFSGLAGGADGRLLWVYSAGAITFAHENGGSTAANRFELASSSNWAFTARTPILLIYDGAASRWKVSKDGVFSTATISGTLNANATVSLGSSDSHVTSVRMPKDSSTAPTLSSCGTSPTVTGGSWAFAITTGSGATGCTATFAATKTNAPTCVVSARDGSDPAYSTSATEFTLTTASASRTYDVICIGDA